VMTPGSCRSRQGGVNRRLSIRAPIPADHGLVTLRRIAAQAAIA